MLIVSKKIKKESIKKQANIKKHNKEIFLPNEKNMIQQKHMHME